MKGFLAWTISCALLLCAGPVISKTPPYGIGAVTEVHPEGENDSTTDLHLAVAITEELGAEGVPLSFNSRYSFSHEVDKAKVLHEIHIYRGADLLWHKQKMARPGEWSDSSTWAGFCDAYDEGLEPGDMIVFSATLVGGLTLEETGGGALWLKVGPKEMWSNWNEGWYPDDSPCY